MRPAPPKQRLHCDSKKANQQIVNDKDKRCVEDKCCVADTQLWDAKKM